MNIIAELTEKDIAAREAQILEEGKVLVAVLPAFYPGLDQPIFHKFGGVGQTFKELIQTFTNKFDTYGGKRTFHIGLPLCIFSRHQDRPELWTMWAKVMIVERSSILRYSRLSEV